MKKLVAAKILLISVVPFWMACGKTAVQSETTAAKASKTSFLKRIDIAPAPLQEGGSQDPAVAKVDVAVEEGGSQLTADEGGSQFTDNEVTAIAEKMDASVNVILESEKVDENLKGRIADLDSDLKGLLDDLVFEEGGSQKIPDRLDQIRKLKEVAKNLAFDLLALEEGGSQLISPNDETFAKISAIEEGIKKIRDSFMPLEEGGSQKLVFMDEGGSQRVVFEGGSQGPVGDINQLIAFMDKDGSAIAQKLYEGGSQFPFKDAGNQFSFSIVDHNVLVVEGFLPKVDAKAITLVVNGEQKFEVGVNDAQGYIAKFALTDENIKQTIIDVVYGEKVATLMISEGQLKAFKF